MKLYGSLSRLVSILFRKNSQDITLQPNQATTYTAARAVQLPPGDTDHVLTSASSTATFTNKSFDADGTGNSITNIENADIKAGAAIDATKIADGSVTSTEFQFINSLTSNAQTQLDAKASITYVDAAINGLSWKQPVYTSTTGNITLSGEQTLDGFLTSANRVLVMAQTAPAENGIYVSAAGAWTRSVDMDVAAEFSGSAVFVQNGTVQGDRGYVETATVVTVGTDPVTFAQFSSAGASATRNLDNLTVASLAVGSLLIGTSTTQVSNLTIGASGTKLKSNGTTASWVDDTFEATWTTGDGTTKAITHNLGTKDVMVQVYDMTNDESILVDTTIRTSTSVVTLTSSEAPGGSSWRVVITAQ